MYPCTYNIIKYNVGVKVGFFLFVFFWFKVQLLWDFDLDKVCKRMWHFHVHYMAKNM